MVTTIKTLSFRNLSNAAHFNYFIHVSKALAAAATPVKQLLAEPAAEFERWLAKEYALMEWVRKSALTKKITIALRRTDRALVGINAQVHAQTYSQDTDTVRSAMRLGIMLRSYGKVHDKAYDDQAGDYLAILKQLGSAYAADAALLGLAPQVTELESAFTEFHGLLTQRSSEKLRKPAETFPEVRRNIERAYRRFIPIVNAGVLIGPAAEMTDFLSNLNGEINRLNAEYHRARKDLSASGNTVIAQIAPQPFTGQDVTPVPTVHYSENDKPPVRLSLGRDFSITYRHNINPGMAGLTIHGKGKYRGAQRTSFMIEEAN